MAVVRILGRLVNKSNSYEVRFNQAFWKEIRPIVEKYKALKIAPYWIGPSGETKAYQDEVAYRFLLNEKREWLHGEKLQLAVRLISQRHDFDSIKVLGDAIQQSGHIVNDRQIARGIIEHVDGKAPAVEIEVNPL